MKFEKEDVKRAVKPFLPVGLYRKTRRFLSASSYYTPKISQIMRWTWESKEANNFTYDLQGANLNYLCSMISLVTGRGISEIQGYIKEPDRDSNLKSYVLEKIRTQSSDTPIDPRCQFGKRLGWYAIARALKPRVIVETGVDKGLGSIILCYALMKNAKEGVNGHYYGTDIDPSAGYLLSDPYSKFGEILYGDSIESLKNLDVSIDLFINDSDHSADYESREYETVSGKLSERAVVLGDNAHVSDRLYRFSLKKGRRFLFFREEPKDHWYPGGGIGFSFK